jgi:hypothetical protein
MIPFEAAGAVVLVGVFLLALKYAIDYVRRKRP